MSPTRSECCSGAPAVELVPGRPLSWGGEVTPPQRGWCGVAPAAGFSGCRLLGGGCEVAPQR